MNDFAAPLAALGLTILIEFAVLALIERHDLGRVLLAAILVNACTEPLASALYGYGIAPWLAIEAAVVLVEAPLYRLLIRTRWARGIALSFFANAASALFGLWLFGR